jgi:hypothetical protein
MKMKMFLMIVAVIVMSVSMVSAGCDKTHCISTTRFNGHAAFKNSCSEPVTVHYCIERGSTGINRCDQNRWAITGMEGRSRNKSTYGQGYSSNIAMIPGIKKNAAFYVKWEAVPIKEYFSGECKFKFNNGR